MEVKKIALNSFLIVCCFSIANVNAVDMNARDFFPAPHGTWSSVTYLGYDHANNFRGVADTNDQARMKVASLVHRLVRFTDCGGFTCSPQIVIPFTNMDIRAPGAPTNRHHAGIGDVSLGAGIWFINRPEERRYMGMLPTIILPVGHYDSNNPGISSGSNRWQFHLNFNNTWALSTKWTMELEAEAQFYGRNNDYMGMTYRQKPIYKLKSYISYDVNPDNYLAGKIIHGVGGKNKLDGHEVQNTYTALTQVGVEYGHLLFKNNHLLFAYTRDIDAKNSFQGDHFQIRFAHSF